MAASVAAMARAASRQLGQASQQAAKRGVHTAPPKQAGYDDDYMHREHMYEPWNMKNRRMKFGLGIIASVGIGILVPIYAVRFQMKKQQMV